ncbi:MAG: beta-propeller fold lactonase family protein [Nitrospinota bacterium]|nr:beta-propeller fold lactonase family protein [Nitrospinota bacterium]
MKKYVAYFMAIAVASVFSWSTTAEAKKVVLTEFDKRDWHVTEGQDNDSPLRDYAILYDAGGVDGALGVIGIPSMRTYRHIRCGVDLHNFPFSGSNAGNNNGTPDGKYLYVSDKGSDTIAEVNLQTGWVERIFALPKPFGIHHSAALAPNGKYLFATGELTGKMLKLRLEDGATTVLDIPPAPSAPDYPDTSKDGKYVFSGNYYHSAIMVFSQDPFKLIKEIPVGKNPHGTNVSPTNRIVAVCDKLSATISVIDVEQLRVAKVIPVGAGPLHNQFDTLGKYDYISCFVSDSTSKLDMQRMQLVDEFPIHYRVGHNSIAPDNGYYVSQNKFSTGLFTPTGIVFAVNFELQDIDESSDTYGKSVKIIPVDGEPHEGRMIFASYIQRWNTGKGEELFSKGYNLGDYHVSFDVGPGVNSKTRPQLEPAHWKNTKKYWIARDNGKPGITKEGDVHVIRIKAFSYGYVPRFIHVPQGAKVRIIFTNIDKAAGLTKNPDVTMGMAIYGHYGFRTMIIGPRGMSAVAEFEADRAGEYEFYCQHFCGPLHLEMRGTFFVDPKGKQASLAVGDYDRVAQQEQLVDEGEREWLVGTNRLLNKLKEGNEPTI